MKEAGPNRDTTHPGQPRRVIVVIDHHAAHIYQDLNGSRPQEEVTVRPYDPFHFHHHLIHRKEAHYRGEQVQEETSFYEDIAKDLAPTIEIVLIGPWDRQEQCGRIPDELPQDASSRDRSTGKGNRDRRPLGVN